MGQVHHEKKHPTVKTYWILAFLLCVITFIEWIVFKVEYLRNDPLFMLPTLSILSLIKFTMVTGWYMHLRYDDIILTKIFLVSALLATMTFVILHLAI